jgi:hypothetical protein
MAPFAGHNWNRLRYGIAWFKCRMTPVPVWPADLGNFAIAQCNSLCGEKLSGGYRWEISGGVMEPCVGSVWANIG